MQKYTTAEILSTVKSMLEGDHSGNIARDIIKAASAVQIPSGFESIEGQVAVSALEAALMWIEGYMTAESESDAGEVSLWIALEEDQDLTGALGESMVYPKHKAVYQFANDTADAILKAIGLNLPV